MHTKNLPALFELLLGFSVQLFKETHSSVEVVYLVAQVR